MAAGLRWPHGANGRLLVVGRSTSAAGCTRTQPEVRTRTDKRGKAEPQMVPVWPYSAIAPLEPWRALDRATGSALFGAGHGCDRATRDRLRDMVERLIRAGPKREADRRSC